MARRQLNLRLDDERREEWENYVEDHRDLSSVSGLIRSSVARRINDDRQAGGGGGQSNATVETSDELTDTLRIIQTTVERLETRVGDMDDRLDAVERNTGGATESLQTRVTNVLPEHRPFSGDWFGEYEQKWRSNEPPAEYDPVFTGEPSSIADRLDVDQERVEAALDGLALSEVPVETDEIDPPTGESQDGPYRAYWFDGDGGRGSR